MRLCKILAVGVLAVLFALPANAAEPYKLRIGWVVAGADFTTLMFARPELAPHAGKTYIPELMGWTAPAERHRVPKVVVVV